MAVEGNVNDRNVPKPELGPPRANKNVPNNQSGNPRGGYGTQNRHPGGGANRPMTESNNNRYRGGGGGGANHYNNNTSGSMAGSGNRGGYNSSHNQDRYGVSDRDSGRGGSDRGSGNYRGSRGNHQSRGGPRSYNTDRDGRDNRDRDNEGGTGYTKPYGGGYNRDRDYHNTTYRGDHNSHRARENQNHDYEERPRLSDRDQTQRYNSSGDIIKPTTNNTDKPTKRFNFKKVVDVVGDESKSESKSTPQSPRGIEKSDKDENTSVTDRPSAWVNVVKATHTIDKVRDSDLTKGAGRAGGSRFLKTSDQMIASNGVTPTGNKSGTASQPNVDASEEGVGEAEMQSAVPIKEKHIDTVQDTSNEQPVQSTLPVVADPNPVAEANDTTIPDQVTMQTPADSDVYQRPGPDVMTDYYGHPRHLHTSHHQPPPPPPNHFGCWGPQYTFAPPNAMYMHQPPPPPMMYIHQLGIMESVIYRPIGTDVPPVSYFDQLRAIYSYIPVTNDVGSDGHRVMSPPMLPMPGMGGYPMHQPVSHPGPMPGVPMSMPHHMSQPMN